MRRLLSSSGFAILAAASLLSACASSTPPDPAANVAMEPVSFKEIPGWADDRQIDALAAFRRSCPKIVAGGDTKISTDGGVKIVSVAEWKTICDAANTVREGDNVGAKRFFEENFRPLAVKVPGSFTGYFEPELRGSRAPSRIFTVPIYRRPVDLTDQPYLTRAEIEQGALKGKGLEIAYVQDPVALFEVQVQGSGRVHLAEGGTLSLGFDGSNNRPYTAIGNTLIEMGVMQKDKVTWPAIRDWLKRNPVKGRDVMRKNERYIFFKDTKSAAATGSEGVPLIAQRSIAIDTTYTPYGTPIWIETTRPVTGKPNATETYRHLMVAQDSGTAIKGPARADVFFGNTPQAADWAGRMVAGGRAIVLVPNRS